MSWGAIYTQSWWGRAIKEDFGEVYEEYANFTPSGVTPLLESLQSRATYYENEAATTILLNKLEACESDVTDTTAPVINLIGDAIVQVIVDDTYTEQGATALDDADGDVSGSIVIGGTVDTTTIGQYTITYNVSDSAGNAATEVTRTVNVVSQADILLPVLQARADYYENENNTKDLLENLENC